MPTIQHASPTTISLNSLLSDSIPFSTLEAAFGPTSLGILVVTDLPKTFPQLRSTVLSNSSRLAALAPEKLESLTDEKAKYLVGWSHGKETLRPGVVDDKKGSFYINCAFASKGQSNGTNTETESSDDAHQNDLTQFPDFPEYTAPSLWPAEGDIPGFRDSAEELISLIIDVAVLVARACDRYAEAEIDGYEPGYLERVVRGSRTSKARLLHYFPDDSDGQEETEVDKIDGDEGKDQKFNDTWCTTHLDHGCLTGLTSAMFLDENSEEYQLSSSSSSTPSSPTSTSTASSLLSPLPELPTSPDPTSGLYIHSRNGDIVKVAIPRDSLAFQTGETLQLMTKGKFKAVPHFVKGVEAKNLVENKKRRIARNTLAVFTQPNLADVVDLDTGLTFGEFARGVVKKNTTTGTIAPIAS
ncbi:hypothetical protein PV10_00677 [Exophiala mesophila]|uniref:Clavaminate synthase-like protein n=1 Tax=Exophiala mesophila TaxID=212818 RepID=A0A0D1ZQG9_EXOME|nr:uncharacterized protein PV10_00677 [Exophiala mesophila]KIV96862.1 hypothetical protein PV10_00677 [Exophiala mesophila]